MRRPPLRLTRRVRRVVAYLHNAEIRDTRGIDICLATAMGPGIVWPILDRLTDAGWATRREIGSPVRACYPLTEIGRMAGREVLGLPPERPTVDIPAGQLILVRTEPVQEIAAEPVTFDTLITALRSHASAPRLGPDLGDALSPLLGWQLVRDPAIPAGFVHLRPIPLPVQAKED